MTVIWYMVLQVWSATDKIFCQFGPFFALLPFWKNEKKAWRYHYFSYVYQKLWPDGVRSLRYAVRRLDGRKKWHKEVGAPPKKSRKYLIVTTVFPLYALLPGLHCVIPIKATHFHSKKSWRQIFTFCYTLFFISNTFTYHTRWRFVSN